MLCLWILFCAHAFGQLQMTGNIRVTGGLTASAAYSPSADSSISLRLVADTMSGADGDNIDPWTASVGTSATDTSTSTPPKLYNNILNGHKVIRFNGTANALESIQAFTGSTYSIFVVGIKRGTNNGSGFLNFHKATGADYDSADCFTLYEGLSGNEYFATYRNALMNSRVPNAGIGTPFVLSVVFNSVSNVNYLGDWSSFYAGSSGAFNSTRMGIGARFDGSAYGTFNQIDIAEIIVSTNVAENYQRTVLNYLSQTYAIAMPKIVVVQGDSISAGSYGDAVWPWQMQSSWESNPRPYHVVNLSTNGWTVTQLNTDATTTLDYRITPTTVIAMWEYVNQYTLNSGDTNLIYASITNYFFNRHAAIAARGATGAKLIAATDFHRGSPSSFNTQPVSDMVRANWPTFADGLSELNLQSLSDDSNNNSDTTHLSIIGQHIVEGIMKTNVQHVLP